MITLTLVPTCPEQAALLGKFLPEYMRVGAMHVECEPEPAVVEQPAAPEAPAKKTKAAKPAPTPAATEAAPAEAAAPAPAAASLSEPTVTLEQVRAKLATLSQNGKAPAVKELLKKYGAAKLTDVAAETYAELLAAAEEL